MLFFKVIDHNDFCNKIANFVKDNNLTAQYSKNQTYHYINNVLQTTTKSPDIRFVTHSMKDHNNNHFVLIVVHRYPDDLLSFLENIGYSPTDFNLQNIQQIATTDSTEFVQLFNYLSKSTE